MNRDRLAAGGLVVAMTAYRDALARERTTLNRLNVYPVPDGDTGTNMLATVESVVAESATLGPDPEIGACCAAISHGSLMGARGNSGVLLCQILRKLAEAVGAAGVVSGDIFAAGLGSAAGAARAAVARPVEGTILTVATRAALGAASADAGEGLHAVVVAARDAALEALWETPGLLPVLAQAGVVDAGGAGLTLLFDAFLVALGDAPAALALPDAVRETLAGAAPVTAMPEGSAPPVRGPRYEVMYLLEAPEEAIGAFEEVWSGLGDSIVVVGGDGLWNCHIHTDDVGASIEAALDAGRPRQIRVSDLYDQVEEEMWVREAAASPPARDGAAVRVPLTGVVAVATGPGIRRIFTSLGVGSVLAGGQTMNPSVAELLGALDEAPGKEIVLLPNNTNIIPVALEVASLSDKPVAVVPTAGVQEGFAALLEYDPEASAEENARQMAAGALRVVSGEVTRAVRPSASEAGPIAAGDWLGLSRSGIEAVSSGLAEVTCALLERLVGPEHEIVTLFEGEGATEAATRRVSEWLRAHRPDVTMERHHGGQPLYPYLVSIE